ncbi:uncharacterized protein RCC_04937 [Ramularia collo-cygni]|uniref:Fungal calcium binding protein domain-containing protein n=1 Tax=Ramularia collo-cygni TaxID=112498 RepID=A0A2D3US96_9PEZI|nr:uncharacterized protein RCC_04937 [Ramularia collo-cygni]CZT19091.1 uncharacterized protein RCC_04937 [Ramularia collo-cygni]
MQFTTVVIAAFAAIAYASPAEVRSTREPGQVDLKLPDGCTKTNLAKCVGHLAAASASCGAAAGEAGLNPVADLACVGSASGAAANFDECKSCIPKKTAAKEDIVVKRDTREPGMVDITLPPGCSKHNLEKCVLHLASTGGSCAAAAAEAGVNPVADIACVASASSTAANFDECKSCIPKKTLAN